MKSLVHRIREKLTSSPFDLRALDIKGVISTRVKEVKTRGAPNIKVHVQYLDAQGDQQSCEFDFINNDEAVPKYIFLASTTRDVRSSKFQEHFKELIRRAIDDVIAENATAVLKDVFRKEEK
jgi:hypothetical protein